MWFIDRDLLIFVINILVGFLFLFFIAKRLRKTYDKDLWGNGIKTIAIIDKYDIWTRQDSSQFIGCKEWCCFFHFIKISDGKTVYGRTIVRDLDIMQKEYPPGTRIEIIYSRENSNNWRIITDNKGNYVKA